MIKSACIKKLKLKLKLKLKSTSEIKEIYYPYGYRYWQFGGLDLSVRLENLDNMYENELDFITNGENDEHENDTNNTIENDTNENEIIWNNNYLVDQKIEWIDTIKGKDDTESEFESLVDSDIYKININDIYPIKFSKCELYLEALNRNINISTNSNPTLIWKNVIESMPDQNWQKDMIIWFFKLSEDEMMLIYHYFNFGYENMNAILRFKPSQSADMNNSINKSIPLPNDIIVFRYTYNNDELSYIPDNGIFTFNGYLSTSYKSSYVTNINCNSDSYSDEHKDISLLRIKVQKGKHCIYIPGKEYELIFPHKTQLNVISKKNEPLIHSIDCKNFKPNKIVTKMVYDIIML